MDNLSLDDIEKIADAAYPTHPSKAWDGNGYQVDWVDLFDPTSPDTLMRLCFELRIDVVWDGDAWEVYNAVLDGRGLVCETPEQIADAIIECSLEMING